MIVGKIKRWGNSVGLLIQKEDAKKLGLKENDEVAAEITKKTNVLKELFGAGKFSKPTEEILKESRKLESRFW